MFDRKPDERSATFAEAQALVDDGLDLDFVLGIFPDDAEWLRDELQFTSELTEAFAFEPPSYYFEASLKSKFLAAAREPVAQRPATSLIPFKTAFASLGLTTAAMAAGVITLGFVTAGSAVPGDWNYSFKLANERLQYTLASGDDRVNIQLKQTEARVEEVQTLSARGELSANDLARLSSEAHAMADLARNQQLDDVQKARVTGIVATGKAVLNDARQKQPALDAPVSAAAAALGDAAVTALATPSPSPSPTPSETPSATPTGTATPSATATATTTPAPTATPSATATPAPTDTPAPSPTATSLPTESPSPTGTASPSATGTPKP
jgi:hypothetical protein